MHHWSTLLAGLMVAMVAMVELGKYEAQTSRFTSHGVG
jgi:hypothetical protein